MAMVIIFLPCQDIHVENRRVNVKTQNSQNVLNRSKIKAECTVVLREYVRTIFVSKIRILHTLGTLIVLKTAKNKARITRFFFFFFFGGGATFFWEDPLGSFDHPKIIVGCLQVLWELSKIFVGPLADFRRLRSAQKVFDCQKTGKNHHFLSKFGREYRESIFVCSFGSQNLY